jgi:hypothetical protein
MTYEEFLEFVPRKCMYETIYEDSNGYTLLVIKLLDAYGMVNKAQRQWAGLTDKEFQQILIQHDGAGLIAFYNLIEDKLRSKNK